MPRRQPGEPPPRLVSPGVAPPPPPAQIYTGPLVPVAYDDNWQHFINLTPEQIAWYEAQPEWQNFCSYVALVPEAASVAMPAEVVAASLDIMGQSQLIQVPRLSKL